MRLIEYESSSEEHTDGARRGPDPGQRRQRIKARALKVRY